MGDFLRKDVETPLCGHFLAAGMRLRIETNFENILAIARSHFDASVVDRGLSEELLLKLWVEEEDPLERHSKPFFRGVGDLVFSGYDERSSILIDLKGKRAAGRLTRSLAQDAKYWSGVLIPSFLAIVAPSLGLTSLHCACVSWKGSGLLLAGDSGAGKSTLSLALAQSGFDYLSDDRILVQS